jgi:membrane protease YdiL (CAAX protease family)
MMDEVPPHSEQRRSWPSPASPRAVPWSGFEIAASLILVIICLPQIVSWLLNVSGFYSSLYDPELVARAHETTLTDAVKLARARLNLWVPLFVLPLQMMTLPLLLFALSQTGPNQLGLTREDGWRNLARGIVGAVGLIPVVLCINALMVLAFKHWAGVEVELHPLFRLGKELHSVEWVALFFAVLVAAPVMEELTLRGLLQPWLAQFSWGGLLAVGVALLIALDARLPGLREAVEKRDLTRFALEVQPAVFVLVMSLGLLVVQRWSRTPAAPAIYGTALLFASLHSFAWPSPIALFVLGLGLGFLAYQTRSLVGPIVLHMLFNAVGCLQFLAP